MLKELDNRDAVDAGVCGAGGAVPLSGEDDQVPAAAVSGAGGVLLAGVRPGMNAGWELLTREKVRLVPLVASLEPDDRRKFLKFLKAEFKKAEL